MTTPIQPRQPSKEQRARGIIEVVSREVDQGAEAAKVSTDYLSDRYKLRFHDTFEAVDQILNPQVLALEIVSAGKEGPPGWTNGETITINEDTLPPLVGATPSEFAAWLGVNHHELGHTLYSPRESSALHARIKAMANSYPNLPLVLNLVEDQRQERLLIAQFRPLRAYLTAAVERFITAQLADSGVEHTQSETGTRRPWGQSNSQQAQLAAAWPLIAGRTWLPVEVRRGSRKAFDDRFGPELGQKVTSLIGQYQRLYDPAIQQADEAFELLVELLKALGSVLPLNQIGGCGKGPGKAAPHGERNAPSQGDDTPAYVDEDDVPVAGMDDAEITADLRKSAEDSTDSDSDSDEDASGGGKDGGAGSDEGQGENDGADPGSGDGMDGGDADSGNGDSDGDGDGDGDGRSEQEGGKSEGSGTGAGLGKAQPRRLTVKSVGDMRSALRDAVVELVFNDEDTKREMRDLRKAVSAPSTGSGLERINEHSHSTMPVSEDMRLASDKMIDHFRMFTDRAMPYWDRRVDHGKLNVRRYLLSDSFMDYETMFDRFDPGHQDELSLDVTVVVDISSSMNAGIKSGHSGARRPPGDPMRVTRAWEMAWVIRRAVQEAEGDCYVLAYNTYSWEVASPDEKAHHDRWDGTNASGGTDPSKALQRTAERLTSSDAAHRLVVLLTDGDWSKGRESVNYLNSIGVTTIAVLVGDGNITARVASIEAQYGVQATDPAAVVDIFEEVAANALAQAEMMADNRGW